MSLPVTMSQGPRRHRLSTVAVTVATLILFSAPIDFAQSSSAPIVPGKAPDLQLRIVRPQATSALDSEWFAIAVQDESGTSLQARIKFPESWNLRPGKNPFENKGEAKPGTGTKNSQDESTGSSSMENEISVPLVLFLNGSNASGSDNLSQVKNSAFLSLAATAPYKGALIVVPQCPLNAAWDSLIWAGGEAPSAGGGPGTLMRLLHSLLEELCRQFPIRSDRRIALGFSLGAYGILDYALWYPGWLSAVVSVGGGADPVTLPKSAKDTLFILFHGERDPNVPVSQSRRVFDALSKSGANVKFFEIRGGAHDVTGTAFSNGMVRHLLD